MTFKSLKSNNNFLKFLEIFSYIHYCHQFLTIKQPDNITVLGIHNDLQIK